MPLAAAIIPAVAGVAGAVVSSNAQKSAAKKAANAQQAASDAAEARIREQMDYARGVAAPHQARGAAASQRNVALWSNSAPNPRAAAYGPYGPGSAYGPQAPASVYGGGPAPVRTISSPGAPFNPVPQVAPPPPRPVVPPPAPAEAPWWQNHTFNPSTPIPPYTPPPVTPADTAGGPGGQGGGNLGGIPDTYWTPRGRLPNVN